MQCGKCKSVNDDDSRFCKRCGQYLYQAENDKQKRPDEQIRVGELIYAAYKHKESGRIDEAILACQGALTLNDQSSSAHTLMASLYEMRGDMDLAIEEYRKVLQVEPGNLGVKEKISYLDNILMAPVHEPGKFQLNIESLRPYLPAISAAVSLCVILLAGFLLIRSTRKTTVVSPERSVETSQSQPVQPAQQGPQGYPQQATLEQQQAYPTPEQIHNPQTAQPQTAAVPAPPAPSNPVRNNSGARDSIRRGIPPIRLPTMIQPTSVAPSGTPIISPVDSRSAIPATGSGSPVIVPVNGNGFQPQYTQPEPPNVSQPSIVYHAPKPSTNGAGAVSPIQPVQDPEERAMQLQGAGRYDDAIRAYQSVVKKSSDKGRIYQQMAISYQRVGKNQQAIDSYKKAIQAYRDQLASGRDAAEVQRDIRACEAGLQVSQGKSR